MSCRPALACKSLLFIYAFRSSGLTLLTVCRQVLQNNHNRSDFVNMNSRNDAYNRAQILAARYVSGHSHASCRIDLHLLQLTQAVCRNHKSKAIRAAWVHPCTHSDSLQAVMAGSEPVALCRRLSSTLTGELVESHACAFCAAALPIWACAVRVYLEAIAPSISDENLSCCTCRSAEPVLQVAAAQGYKALQEVALAACPA